MRLFIALSILCSFTAQAEQLPLMLPVDEPELPYLAPQQDLFPQAKGGLTLRVPQYRELLGSGMKVRCLVDEEGQFGYEIRREANGETFIEGFSNGKLEGEAARMKAEIKDYGPMLFYVSVYNRFRDTGTYFDIMLEKRMKSGGYVGGDAMFTETYYTKNGDKEDEEYKPISKKPLRCGEASPL